MGKFCTRAELVAWEMALEAFPERLPLSIQERLLELFPAESELVLNGPESFMNIPADFTFPDEKKADVAAPVKEKKEPQQIFHFAEVKTQYIDDDLSFCECLAKAYGRLSEDKNEKVFLRGNTFLAKLAKAVFEQNENLFAETCEKHKDEAYFDKCSESLAKQGFFAEKGEKFNETSWRNLYKAVSLSTESAYSNGNLPKINVSESNENSDDSGNLEIIVAKQDSGEEDLKKAGLVPLKEIDFVPQNKEVETGLFYQFLCNNFSYEKYKDRVISELPRPEFELKDMYVSSKREGRAIYLNQQLVKDSFDPKKQDDRFILLLVMLLEYGNLLEGSNDYRSGRVFVRWFMEHSKTDLFNSNFEFANFTDQNFRSDKQEVISISRSSLDWGTRKGIFYTLVDLGSNGLKMQDYKTKWGLLYEKSKLPVNKDCEIYKAVKNGGIGDFHYAQMHDRLEKVGVDGKLGEEGKELGYILRALWWRYEKELRVHDTKMHGGICEKDWNDLSEIEKKERSKKENFGKFMFNKKNGTYGVYIDLVYDTFWKDWEKPYQNTFHEFFHNIDYVANPTINKYFSYTYLYENKHLGETVYTEVDNISIEKKEEIHKLSKHSKAYLYDIMGGVRFQGKYPYEEKEQFGHEFEFWKGENLNDSKYFSLRLAVETFANMASVAIVNPESFIVMKNHLPKSYKMFLEILKRMVLGI